MGIAMGCFIYGLYGKIVRKMTAGLVIKDQLFRKLLGRKRAKHTECLVFK